MESTQVKSTMALLDLVMEWNLVHVNILERWESKKYFGYALLS